jgi:hypothetical protein
MHRLKKMRLVSLLVALVMAFGLIPFAAPQTASADITSITNNLQAVYFWLGKDSTGTASITSAANNFNTSLASVSAIESLVWPNGPTSGDLPISPSIATAFGSAATAQEDIAQLIIDMSKTIFSANETAAVANLLDLAASTNDINTVATLTDHQISEDELVEFLGEAESNGINSSLGQSSNWQQILQSESMSSSQPLIDTIISGALRYAGNNGYSSVYNALANVGWSIDSLSNAVLQVNQQVDPSSQAEIALLKAFVRSQAHVSATPPMLQEESLSLGTGASMPLTINVFGDVVNGLTLESGNIAEVSVSGNTITGVAQTSSPVEITAYYSNPSTDWVYKADVTVTASSTGGGGGGGGATAPTGVTSTTGSASVTPNAGGTISLNSTVTLNIPANALNGSNPVNVVIQQSSNPPAAPSGFMFLGTVYDFSIGGSESYTFNSPVTLTFTFDPSQVPAEGTPTVAYHDTSTNQWVSIGGTVSGDTITVSVSHFTMYAVMVKQAATTPPTPAQIFSDVPASYWASGTIDQFSTLGYIAGYPDGTFKPDNRITRAEFVTILDKALKLAAYTPTTANFKDVSAGDWYYGSVESAVYAGFVTGCGNGGFAPNDPITRQEIAVILVNACGKAGTAQGSMNAQTSFSDDSSIAAWARGFVNEASQLGLIKGYPDSSFAPVQDATRAEACVMINNLSGMMAKQ